MTSTRQIVHDTYVRTKPPVLDLNARTIRFNFTLYAIPDDVPIESLYDALADAVTSRNMGALIEAIAALRPYQTQTHVKAAWRQTEIYDPFDRTVVH